VKYLNDVQFYDKLVFVRVDFNVSLDQYVNINDDSRIRAVLPTINYVLNEQAKVVIASHMGRPRGQIVSKLSMAPIAKRLSLLLKKEVKIAPDCVGLTVKKMVQDLKRGEILMLENLRFHSEETLNDEEFSKELAAFCDVYINDAFAVAHRNNASIDNITKYVPISVAGFNMKKELEYLDRSMINSVRPLAVVIGGAKVVTKLPVLENFLKYADKIIIGGAMANTFLVGVGYKVGKSLYEKELVSAVHILSRNAKRKNVSIYIPVDCIVASDNSKYEIKVVTVQDVVKNLIIMDIGPATSMLFREALSDCKTIIWNGPMGAFEVGAFSRGTYNMISTIAYSSSLSIIGGGDTNVAVSNAGETHNVSYVSTGGGAFLALLAGKKLPAVEALGGY